MTDPNPTAPPVPKTILVGTDYSLESRNAANHALELARCFGANVHLLHAWLAPYARTEGEEPAAPVDADHPDLFVLMRRSAEEQMTRFLASLDTAEVVVTTSVESGDPKTILLRHAERHDCDWVVLGKRSSSPIADWFLGNVAAYVVRHCQAPVLVVPNGASA